ncbi:MAG: hypothetical protein ACXWXC_12625 [Aeromicrobium sp.]
MTGTDLRRSACHRYREEHQVFVDAAELMGGVELPRLTRALRLRDARIETRAKTVASFAKKAWLKREKYTDPWEQITDKVGGRIVVTSLRDLEALTDAVVNQRTGLKTLTEVDDKLHHLEVDRVGYLGRHVDVVVPGLRTADQGQIRCELQLRTLAMDLWAVTDYGLAYKSAAPLSSASARRLNRLAAINEIFDESVDQTLRELSQSPLAPLTELLRHAESIFLDFNDTPGRDDISLEVLQEVLPTIELPVDEYGDLLETFAARHHDKLAAIYDAFGAGSPWETDAKYIEFTQPESLVLFERIDAHDGRLDEAIRGSTLQGWVEALRAAWTRPE